MARNIEIKARGNNLAKQCAAAETWTDQPVQTLHQIDTFFHTRSGRLKLRQFANGQAELIGYERPNTTGPKLSQYQRTPIPNPDTFLEMMTTHHGILGEVRKERIVVLVGQTRIHFDRVRDLGDFIELEVVLHPNQSEREGEQIAQQLMDRLHIDPSQLIACAYIDLLVQST